MATSLTPPVPLPCPVHRREKCHRQKFPSPLPHYCPGAEVERFGSLEETSLVWKDTAVWCFGSKLVGIKVGSRGVGEA
ncbi:hypothetical protein WN943_019687 [Citrus x changshan-huyou]